ncbi:hypothetical protein E2P81_ATG08900 [Venturia nashicola]|uniref:Uncharacterized protein n=1 Tax=Venturia nashicola TaxID=86259 RepID=A0A4Z1NY04_9PEZI|nr:hypothetical protein E6O75_ATG09097 [Venturia nashicola]TLD23556.1 hypothetical protein E2P81_ATG08900 [Venturia nashicola]
MKPTPRNRNPSVKAAVEKPVPTTRLHNTTAKVSTATPTPKPMTRAPSGQAEPEQLRVILKLKGLTTIPNSQLASPPITPVTPPAAHNSIDATPESSSKTTGKDPGAVSPPRWMKMQGLQIPTLPGLSTPLTVPAKTYNEPILKLPPHIRHRIFDLVLNGEGQTTLSTFGNYREWIAPAIVRVNSHFLEDALPVLLRRTTLVIHRGEEFSAAKVLSNGATRSAMKKLEFPRAYLNSPNDLRIFEIMRACPSLREITLDICVDHLLRPTLDNEGELVGWESMPFSEVDKQYSLYVIAHLPNVKVLNCRLVGDCYGWKRRLVQPVLDEVATFLLQFTSGRLVFQSLGWWGRRENGFGSRMPTVRGDGLVLVKENPEAMDCSA